MLSCDWLLYRAVSIRLGYEREPRYKLEDIGEDDRKKVKIYDTKGKSINYSYSHFRKIILPDVFL